MQKLMSVTKNITKSAFVLGFMLQAAYAMDDQGSDKRTPPVKADFQEIKDRAFGFLQATAAVNATIAQLLVETNSPALPEKYRVQPSPVMRTGNSLEQEFDTEVKDRSMMGLIAKGIDFECQQLAEQMHPDDLAAAKAFLSQFNN
jgi:hypothetical protein